MNIEKFKEFFNTYREYNHITIRYTKKRDNDITHKEIIITYDDKNNKYTIEHLEKNESRNSINTLVESEDLTSETLKDKHRYIATLFESLPNPSQPKKNFSDDFRRSESKPKWLVRKLLLDTKLIGGTVGKIIAFAANKENPHYKTISSHILANTLGPLIFPGGNKKPILKNRGTILIDSILHKQYKAMRVFEKNYTRDENTINFMDKEVEMELNGQKIKLDTITASNKLETDEEDKKLYVVYFNGNSGCYQQDYKMVAEDLIAYKNKGYNATAVQFNYPGVLGNGQVNKAQQLVDAGIAQVKKLLDDGVPHNQIILHGESLGGSIATHVAAHFHKLAKTDDQTQRQRQTLGGVYASKTFASTAQVGRDFFNRALGDNIFSRTISTLCLPFIKLGTWGSEWDLDTGAKFFSLPRNKRNYSVVLSPHTVRH